MTAAVVPRAVCVTGSLPLRRTLRRTLGAAGSQVEFHDSVDGADPGNVALLVLDQVARRALKREDLDALPRGAGLIVIGDSLENDDVVEMLHGKGVDHLISDADDPDDAEIVVTSVKLLSGDIFGLEKYLAWGVKIGELEVRSYEQKREAMADVVDHLADVSARVLVLSGDASLGVARQLVGDLCSLRDGVTVVDGNDVAVRRAVALARQGDVLLVLDLRRYDRWVIDAAKAARQNGVWIVAVTDSLLSPLASLAERTLTVAAAGGGPFDSHVGTLALANVLVAGVADRLRVHAADRLDRTEAAWRAGSSLVER